MLEDSWPLLNKKLETTSLQWFSQPHSSELT
jgi:hypothetical protein